MILEALVITSCVAQVACEHVSNAYTSTNPPMYRNLKERADMLVYQTPLLVREYAVPYLLWASGRKAVFNVYGHYAITIHKEAIPLLTYTRSF